MSRIKGTVDLRRLRRRNQESEHRDRWLISYADLVTLLLAFFIVLYAASDRERAAKIVASLNAEGANNQAGLSGKGVLPGGDSLVDEKSKIEAILAANPAFAKNVKVSQTTRGTVISIAEAGFFAAGEAELSESAVALVDALASALTSTEAPLRVEGHTDSTPISTARYPSNWELSTARAATVLTRFIQKGINPARLSAAGYGGEQPIADNATPEGRSQNRRVDIVVLNR